MNISKVFAEAMPTLLEGFRLTVIIALLSLLIATAIGLLTCAFNMSKIKPLQWIAKFYLWIIRGTPLLVQGFFVYFALPQAMQAMGIDFRITIFNAGLLTLSLNAGAYISEIFRGGILAVSKGQMEAARSLGLSRTRAMIKVVLPQAMKISIPALVNQCIITLKDTSILQPLGLQEIVYKAKNYSSVTAESFATWTVVAMFYLAVVTVLSFVSSKLEKKTQYK